MPMLTGPGEICEPHFVPTHPKAVSGCDYIRMKHPGGLLALCFVTHLLMAPVLWAQTQVPRTTTSASKASSESSQEAPSAPATTGPADRAIPLPQIADRAEELDRWLEEITDGLSSEADLLRAEEEVKRQSEELSKRLNQVDELLASQPTTLERQSEQRFWRVLSQKYATQSESLTPRAAKLAKDIHILDEQQVDWEATWDQIHERSEIETVVERTSQELTAIRKTRAALENQLNLVLTLQNQVSQMDRQISDVLLRIREAEDWSRSRLFEQDSRPLWEVHEFRNLNQALANGIRSFFDRSFKIAVEFLRVHKLAIACLLTSYFLALLGAFKLRRQLEPGGGVEVSEMASKVLDSPFSIALLVALVGTMAYMRSAPLEIAVTFCILYMIPVLRFLPPLLEPPLRKFLYVLAVFYLLEGVYLLIRFPPLVRREVHSLIVFTALICFTWLARPSRWRALIPSGRKFGTLTIGIPLGLILLASSLTANICGFNSLAQILSLTALVGAFAGTALYCAARILMVILSTILRSNWARPVHRMEQIEQMERWAWRAAVPLAILLWLEAMSRLLTIYDTVAGYVARALSYPIGFQRVHVTLGSILSFLFILIVGYGLANLLAFALGKLLLSRFPLQRGLPFTISKVTYYLLLVLVFLAALVNAGMELNKFTLVTGALGVGVGFGLQNIVNNFVSGLILLFERPIRVGDIVETKGLAGVVKRIGARSSTIQTGEDAEVIVPNSNLISNEVINWTLSSVRRRVDIPVGVAYGTAPERVLSLLIEVAAAHSGVTINPKPEAYFVGFGDNALNFELRFWTYQEDWFRLKSDVTVGLAKALREANIEIPFPQRDLHIRGVGGTTGETASIDEWPISDLKRRAQS
jgi:potassium-dependent mechanosensitive channel